ncbi:MAG: MFS transporter [Cyclonatronaceae bacterium]
MNFLRFIKANAVLLFFGVLMTFLSGFGQTFLFSLFLPQFQETFSMTSGSFGTFYSVITLASAVLLPWSGALIDRFSLRSYALCVAVMIGASALLISVSHSLIPLFIGMLGVRHGGQGLMSHTSQTTMARYFDHVRGKALSISSLGHPLGEALIPVSIAFLIGLAGWRMSWTAIGLFVLAAGLVLIPLLLKNAKAVEDTAAGAGATGPQNQLGKTAARSWTRAQMLRDARFYFVIPAGLASPFLMTGFFLYQVPLAEFKGWSVEWMASCFIGFAAAKTSFSLFSGPVIDRFSAQRVYPFMLIPLAIGLLVLAGGAHPLTALAYMYFWAQPKA